MLGAFFDDSGTHDGSAVVAMGGLLGTDRQWDEFETRWVALLNEPLPGKLPLEQLPDRRCVIFVHGCFWHRHTSCSKATMPKARISFWADKFEKNVARDRRNARAIRKLGWKVVTGVGVSMQAPRKAIQTVEALPQSLISRMPLVVMTRD
jgi:hypothetical protein